LLKNSCSLVITFFLGASRAGGITIKSDNASSTLPLFRSKADIATAREQLIE